MQTLIIQKDQHILGDYIEWTTYWNQICFLYISVWKLFKAQVFDEADNTPDFIIFANRNCHIYIYYKNMLPFSTW